MHVRTKIICTIGPAVSSYEKIYELIHAGMNVARLNFSHGTHEEHEKIIQILKNAREDLKKPLAIMLDTKGPEIRLKTPGALDIRLKQGDFLSVGKKMKANDPLAIQIHPEAVVDQLEKEMKVLFDDGYIEGVVVNKHKDHVVVEILNPGVLKNSKKMNIPHGNISLPAMTAEDIDDLTFGCKQDVDIIAASFIRSADNVLEIRKHLKKQGKSDILIISKIESVLGVKNFESILQVSDGIMIARGDLGVELPLNQVPQLQKMMIRKCNLEGKIVVTATQMLESMIQYPRPTRAEVSDVANAIYDSTSCVMLSGETAMGKYPIETTGMMKSIVEEAEKDFDYEGYDKLHHSRNYTDTSNSIAVATVKTAYKSLAHAIFTYTSSGFTAKNLSKFRPKIPIISLTNSSKTFHQLSVVWGVIPLLRDYTTAEQAFDLVTCFALQKGYVHYGDRVFVTAGSPFGVRGTTNMMMIKNIGDVAARGLPGRGKSVYAQAVLGLSQEKAPSCQGKILVIAHFEPKYEPWVKEAAGIVLQNYEEDAESELTLLEIAKTHDIPVLVRAEAAASLIKEGEWITLAPGQGLVFRGEISSQEEILKAVCKSDGLKKESC